VPEVEDLHAGAVLVDPIEYLVGLAVQFADSPGGVMHRAAMRQGAQAQCGIEQRAPYSAGRTGVVLCDVFDNLPQVLDRL